MWHIQCFLFTISRSAIVSKKNHGAGLAIACSYLLSFAIMLLLLCYQHRHEIPEWIAGSMVQTKEVQMKELQTIKSYRSSLTNPFSLHSQLPLEISKIEDRSLVFGGFTKIEFGMLTDCKSPTVTRPQIFAIYRLSSFVYIF